MLAPLLRESTHEFMSRLVTEFENGANRFDRPGEALFGAFAGPVADSTMIGICGLNLDPYLKDGHTGRVRHLYVLADWRRAGVGRQLVGVVIAEARQHFDQLTLWTNDAAPFYRALGFVEDDTISKATHHMKLR